MSQPARILRLRRLGAFSLALALVTLERTAHAEPEADAAQAACISAYESLQEARARGNLLTSREQAFECASSACPSFMQTDCAAWLEEIETEVPSVSFEVRGGEKVLGAVRISEGERVLAERVDGGPVELDPGTHWLLFEADGYEPVTKPIVIERGAKNQHFTIELPVPPPKRRAPTRPAAVPAESDSAAPWVAGAIGLAGVTAFGILGASGLSQEASLERSCAPNCSEADLRSVQTKYLLADISLGVGIAGFLAGAYFLFAPDEPTRRSAQASLHVRATPHGGMASVRSTF